MRSGLHNIGAGFISGKTASLQQIGSGFVRAADEGGAAAVVSSFASSDVSSANSNGYTFGITGMLTSGHRIIGVAGRDASTRTITSVTLDGQAATLLGTQVDNSGSSAALFIAPATANATGNLVISLSNNWLRCAGGVINVLNLQSTTPTDTASDITPSSNTLSVAIDVEAGGAAFGSALFGNASSATWSGITEAWDRTTESICMTGAGADFASAQTGLSVEATGSGGTNPAMIVVAMR